VNIQTCGGKVVYLRHRREQADLYTDNNNIVDTNCNMGELKYVMKHSPKIQAQLYKQEQPILQCNAPLLLNYL